jgi:hypothetical protein
MKKLILLRLYYTLVKGKGEESVEKSLILKIQKRVLMRGCRGENTSSIRRVSLMVRELCGSSSRSKVIGPSVQDIASIYKAGNIAFLVEDAAPIDPSQYVKKTNFVITSHV